uniref:CP-type G domain-containing protein n=2 Tax=Spongospora subterranea TaxID=70186 RepID=A0A0H5QQF6_9EUKA|eukprot:CRZ04300.1 hypothetical protein [Spongospora subterranea]
MVLHKPIFKMNRKSGKNGTLSRKSSKDPGVPNLSQFKAGMCRQLLKKQNQMAHEAEKWQQLRDEQSEQRRLMISKATDNNRIEISDDNACSEAGSMGSRSWYFKELRRVVDTADVLLIVLDARDPMGCRSIQLEHKIMDGQLSGPSAISKRIVFILNKIDLVPREVADGWLKYLRKSFPTVAFKASTQKQRSNLTLGKGKAESASDASIDGSGCVGADQLLQLLKNYSRNRNIKTALSVGLIGYPNTGKSSIINSLKRCRAVHAGSTPGLTKSVQEVHLDGKIRLLDSPGVLFNDDESNVLRNAIRIESIEDPCSVVASVLDRVPSDQLRSLYGIGTFTNASEFLFRVAHARGKLKRGGIPDLEGTARIVLYDWNDGRIQFWAEPPVDVDDIVNCERPQIVDQFSKSFVCTD